MSQTSKLITTLTLLLLLIGAFGYVAYELADKHALFSKALGNQGYALLNSYFLLGIGFGVPLIALAIIFGWLQFILLMTGHISPHLAREGFFKVLQTLFSRL
jgi:hypothetical protein